MIIVYEYYRMIIIYRIWTYKISVSLFGWWRLRNIEWMEMKMSHKKSKNQNFIHIYTFCTDFSPD